MRISRRGFLTLLLIAQVYLAAAADTGGDRKRATSLYFDDHMKAVKPNEAATDSTLASKLWELSEKLTSAKIEL